MPKKVIEFPNASAIAFGACLARLRGEKGISQAELADAIGAHRNTVHRVERGEPLTFSLFFKICRALELDPVKVIELMIATADSLKKRRGTEAPPR